MWWFLARRFHDQILDFACFSLFFPDFSILLSFFFSRFSVSNIIFAFLFSFSLFFISKILFAPLVSWQSHNCEAATPSAPWCALPCRWSWLRRLCIATTGGFGRRRRSAYVFDSAYMEVLIYLFLVPCSIYFVTGYYRRAYENIQELQQINYLASISSNRRWASSMYTLPATRVLFGRHAVPLAHGWLALDDVRMVYSMYTISSFFSSKKRIDKTCFLHNNW